MGARQDEELDQLNRAYRPALMTYFLRRLRDHAEAEDMTQDVFIRLAGADRTQMRQPDAYIFRIASNLLRDRARKEKIRFDHRAEAQADPAAGVEPLDPSRVLAGRQALNLMWAGLRELPELTRAVFVLYRIENVDKRAIAEAFHISVQAVDRQLTKAMAHLVARVRGAE